jgi:hypothetical protein
MFKLFKQPTPVEVVVKESTAIEVAVEKPKFEVYSKSVAEVIEEIHETFYTEVDSLMALAKTPNSLDTTKQALIDKCQRLEKLGFTNTKEAKEAQSEIARLKSLEEENTVKANLVEAINYFSFKYPNYKFITEESVKRICKKYNLVYGSVANYIGTVPDENLKHIEDFKIKEEDECFLVQQRYPFASAGTIDECYTTLNGAKEFKNQSKSLVFTFIDKCPLEIVAPLKDFNMEGKEVKNHKISKIEIPDPIVLKPVIFNNQKHYLIVTAWGLEAADELVANANHN